MTIYKDQVTEYTSVYIAEPIQEDYYTHQHKGNMRQWRVTEPGYLFFLNDPEELKRILFTMIFSIWIILTSLFVTCRPYRDPYT